METVPKLKIACLTRGCGEVHGHRRAEASRDLENGRLRRSGTSAQCYSESSPQERGFHPLHETRQMGHEILTVGGPKPASARDKSVADEMDVDLLLWSLTKPSFTKISACPRHGPNAKCQLDPTHAQSSHLKPCPRGALISTGFVLKRFLLFFPFKDKL